MNASEAVELIQQRMGGAEGLETRIQLEMVAAQEELEHSEPKPEILLTSASDIVVNSQGYFTVPSGFLREYTSNDQSEKRTSALWVADSNGAWCPMFKERLSKLRQDYGYARGRPKAYDLVGTTAWLFPTPEDGTTYTLQLLYYKSDVPPLVGGTNKWLQTYPGLLINKTGLLMCMLSGDADAVKMWTALYGSSLQAFNQDNLARAEANLQTIYGGGY